MPDHPFGLGRIYREDPRDAEFRMARKLPEVSPVGARLWDVPILYNQGSHPSCTGFSSSGAMTGIFYSQQGATVAFDAEQLYAWANAHDGDPSPHDGATVRAAFTGLIQIGDQIVQSSDSADPVHVYEKAQNYLWADTTATDADIDRLITWLLTVSPVVIGISWYQDMFASDPAGNFVVPPGGFIHPTGDLAGGHAICVRGVNANDRDNTYFVLRNSWGPWGIRVNHDWTLDLDAREGDILVSKEDMISLLSHQGEAGALVDNLDPVGIGPVPVPGAEVQGILAKVEETLERAKHEVRALFAELGL